MTTSKSLIRWWWLAGPFVEADIRKQLEWVRDAGFGGVELAWLDPAWLVEEESDRLRPAWLSDEWRALVAFTKRQAGELALGCDFTLGSCWPFGGSWVRAEDASQTFDGWSEQRLRGTWEATAVTEAFVMNHLSASALRRYAAPMLGALRDALVGPRSALFCDSLELETADLWSPELWDAFEQQFGYSLRPYAADLNEHRDVLYDYRKFIGETIRREFYEAFTRLCHENGAYSRVQCHGAPTDLLAAYAAADVPESESLLFPPVFSRIAASAAAWAGKHVVSAETFTCIYGFPGREESAEEYWKREDLGDLKLLADALFANGVNQIVWHGMPYQPAGEEIEFYASVHVGPDSCFAGELREFNGYLERVSGWLREGETYGGVGVYFPWEDALHLGELPPEMRTPGANFYWEMRHVRPPAECEGFQPLWISGPFLREAYVEKGFVRSRELNCAAIYVDCEWMDGESLRDLARLAAQGARLIWKGPTREPGRGRDADYAAHLRYVMDRSSLSLDALGPLLTGDDLPLYWARKVDEDLVVFFAHPVARDIVYPMPYRLSARARATERSVRVNWGGRKIDFALRFGAQESLLYLISRSGAVRNLEV